MSYEIRIHKPFQEQIAQACHKNKKLIGQVYAELFGELAQHPNKYRHRTATGFQHAFEFRVRLTDPKNPRRKYLFTFLVEDQSAKGRFLITAFIPREREF
jgi:hypothetical protein